MFIHKLKTKHAHTHGPFLLYLPGFLGITALGCGAA